MAALSATALNATRQNGDKIANTSVGSGRIFMVENEPLLDIAHNGPKTAQLVLYAKPGTPLVLQSSPDLRNAANWKLFGNVTMNTTFYPTNITIGTNPPVYFRLLRGN